MNAHKRYSTTDGVAVEKCQAAFLPQPLAKDRTFLQNLLENVRNTFIEDWIGTQLGPKLSSSDASHIHIIQKYKDQSASLEQKLAAIQQLKVQLSKDQAEANDRVCSIEGEISRCQSELDDLLRAREDTRDSLLTMQQKQATFKADVEKKEQVMQDSKGELKKAVAFFRDGLALELKKVPGDRMQLVYTCIDRKEPSKPYYLSVKITPERSYEVSDCHPTVADLDSLVAKLNSTNNFQAFVIIMRQRFKQLV